MLAEACGKRILRRTLAIFAGFADMSRGRLVVDVATRQPGQVRKEAALTSRARVAVPASRLSLDFGRRFG